MNPQPPGSSTHNSVDAMNGGHGAGNASTLRDRILLRPDAHIGSVEKRARKLWIHEENGVMAQREVTYVPGLLKIFDEVLVHAADNHHAMDTLRVVVDAAGGSVSVYCTGAGGVPIAVHRDMPVYVPETIFGHLVGNPDNGPSEIIVTGVKLANVFSAEFIVEIADGPGQRQYKQVFSDNMGTASTGYTEGTSWTRVTFTPDLARFNMARLDEDDAVALMRKRTFDMTGVLGSAAVRVEFNGKMLPQGFTEYVFCHVSKPWSKFNGSGEPPLVCEKVNGQWDVAVVLTDGAQFEQVSFVNRIATVSGGTHVDHVAKMIAAHVVTNTNDGGKFERANIQEEDVKRHLMVFVNLRMENPTFDSPTREALTTPQEEFGSDCELPDLFYAKLRRSLSARLYRRIK